MEDKKIIVIYLKMLLEHTRAGSGLKELVLSDDQKEVCIIYENGQRTVNIDGDSGLAMIKDVLKIF